MMRGVVGVRLCRGEGVMQGHHKSFGFVLVFVF